MRGVGIALPTAKLCCKAFGTRVEVGNKGRQIVAYPGRLLRLHRDRGQRERLRKLNAFDRSAAGVGYSVRAHIDSKDHRHGDGGERDRLDAAQLRQ